MLPGFPSPLADRIELHEISAQSIQWAVAGFAIEIGDRKIAAFACHICGDGLIGIALRAELSFHLSGKPRCSSAAETVSALALYNL